MNENEINTNELDHTQSGESASLVKNERGEGCPAEDVAQSGPAEDVAQSGPAEDRTQSIPAEDRAQGIHAEPVASPIPTSDEKQQKKPKKKGGFWKKAVAAVFLAVVFGAAAGGTFYGVCRYTGLLDKMEQNPTITQLPGSVVTTVNQTPAQNQEIKMADTDEIQVVTTDITEIVEAVMPAMVTILNTSENSSTNIWGQKYTWEEKSSGTGIVIAQTQEELLIVTNHHVAESASTLEITFIDGTKLHAKVKGMDSEMDLAVLAIPLSEIPAETKSAIVIAKMGDSNSLKLGQPTIVIGNALGYGISVTEGVVSGLEREMTVEDGTTGTFIQTSAAVNHGNSGGALLNIKGEVIGIVSNKIDGYGVEGMGYAIPISEASPVIAELMDRQTRTDKVPEEELGYLGVTLQTLNAEAKQYYDMPDGIYVYEVAEGSAAQKAGILKRDIIVKVEGEKVSTYEDLRGILDYYRVGDQITVSVSRQEAGEFVPYDFVVVLGEKPQE